MERIGLSVKRLVIFSALILISCKSQDDKICEPPPKLGEGGMSGCLHRAAYQFAKASGSNSDLAKAVVVQCDPVLLNQVTNSPIQLSPAEMDALYNQSRKNAFDDAIRRIIQAKAGNCAKPD